LSERDFKKLLLEAVDEGLSSLGNSSKKVLYSHLDKGFRIKKQEIPEKIDAFADAIENIFGVGAGSIEVLIMKRLHEKAGQNLRWHAPKDLIFTDYVTVLRRDFLENEATGNTAKGFVECGEILVEG
jgi:hypothetical protein